MKKKLIILLPVTALFILLTAFHDNNQVQFASPADGFEIPEDITVIFDKSCFGCHNVDAKSDKSKKKLMIDKLGALSKAKLLAKMEISDVVKKNEMPPEKFLEKYPDNALTKEEAKRLKEWADEVADELMK